MSSKQNLALLFGGKNTEHEISILTASTVFKNLDQSKYEIKLIYIDKNGVWKIVDDFDSITELKDTANLQGDLSNVVELFVNQDAVLGKGDDIQASDIGEIRPKTDFYSYETKYTDGQADLIISALVDEDVRLELRRQAKMAFKALDCKDLARVDFFLTIKNEIYINEINTLPGFTSLSMYPML